jgi:hypothetical protein
MFLRLLVKGFELGDFVRNRVVSFRFWIIQQEVLIKLNRPIIVAELFIANRLAVSCILGAGVVRKILQISLGDVERELITKRHVREIPEKIADARRHVEIRIFLPKNILHRQDGLTVTARIKHPGDYYQKKKLLPLRKHGVSSSVLPSKPFQHIDEIARASNSLHDYYIIQRRNHNNQNRGASEPFPEVEPSLFLPVERLDSVLKDGHVLIAFVAAENASGHFLHALLTQRLVTLLASGYGGAFGMVNASGRRLRHGSIPPLAAPKGGELTK